MAGVSRDINLQGALQGAIDQAQTLGGKAAKVREDLAAANREADALSVKVGPSVMGDGIPPGPVTEANRLRDEWRSDRGWVTPQMAQQLPPEAISELQQVASQRPGAKRYRTPQPFDTPDEHGPDQVARRASDLWRQMEEGGAYHQMQMAGQFGMTWGDFLKGDQATAQRRASNAAGSAAGREYMSVREEMEGLAQKILGLQEALAGGGSAAVKAALDLAKAQEALEGLSKRGKKASEEIGGEFGGRLGAEMDALKQDISAGNVPKAPGGGGATSAGASGHHLWSVMTNPQGAVHGLGDMVGPAVMERLANGGGGSWDNLVRMATRPLGAGATAAGLAVGIPAAAYAGWKFNEWRADATYHDTGRHLEDFRLGGDLGVDWRGSLYDSDRKYWGDHQLNVQALREEIMPAFSQAGVNLRGWSGGPMGGMRAANFLWGNAEKLGMAPQALASYAANTIQSGAGHRSEESVVGVVKEAAHYLQEMRDAGISTSESMSNLARLNQQQVDLLGKLTPENMRFNQHLLEALAKTGDPSLRGAGAVKAASSLGSGNVEDNTMALLYGQIDKKNMGRFLGRHFGEETGNWLAGQDVGTQVAWIRESASSMTELKGRAAQGPYANVMPWLTRGKLFAGESMHRMKEMLHALPTTEDGWDDWARRRQEGVIEDFGGDVDRSAESAKRVQTARARENDRDQGSMGWGVASELKDASANFKDAVSDFKTAVSQFIEGREPTKKTVGAQMGTAVAQSAKEAALALMPGTKAGLWLLDKVGPKP